MDCLLDDYGDFYLLYKPNGIALLVSVNSYFASVPDARDFALSSSPPF